MNHLNLGRYIILLENIRGVILNQKGSPDPNQEFERPCIRTQIVVSYKDGTIAVLDFPEEKEAEEHFNLLGDILEASP